MRWLIIAVSLMLASGTFAQDAQQSPKQATTPTTSGTPPEDVKLAHPEYFREPDTYKPCPAFAVFPNRQHDCLGCPSVCPWRGVVR
jgi:hypothetical protein